MSAQRDPVEPAEEATPAPRAMTPVAILLYRGLGMAALGLGILGAFLPLLPTTVFLIIAAWAFGKSAPKLRARMYAHRRFGPTLRAWDERGAIPPRAKIAAVAGMGISWGIVLFSNRGPLVPALVGVTLLACAAYVLTRPSA
ncbi:YbaN family protein [Phenylobacterium sp.]|jgi:uncharacterized membrane protein YbaN (DUF454 family)|uniref:YbaN family protein n=1 Tax=Phenylobacterium sp. TaxID=1871053 RepID=UPI0030039483